MIWFYVTRRPIEVVLTLMYQWLIIHPFNNLITSIKRQIYYIFKKKKLWYCLSILSCIHCTRGSIQTFYDPHLMKLDEAIKEKPARTHKGILFHSDNTRPHVLRFFGYSWEIIWTGLESYDPSYSPTSFDCNLFRRLRNWLNFNDYELKSHLVHQFSIAVKLLKRY